MNPGFFITFRALLQQHLFNEFMAKDTSRKIKGAFRAKFLNGERMYSIAPFGYVKQPKIKNKLRMVRTPDEKCLRIEGTHEAIIETEVFESVQKQIASRRQERKNKTMQIFSGLLKCADCGWAMRYCARTGERNPYAHYMCGKYKDFQTRGRATWNSYQKSNNGLVVSEDFSLTTIFF